MNILDFFVKVGSTPQNAPDIFKGEWSSSLPGSRSVLQAGKIPLFEESRNDKSSRSNFFGRFFLARI